MENKIAILTDSTTDLPDEILKSLPVFVLPLKIIYSDAQYRDKVDITPEEIYANFDKEIPTTSLPEIQETNDKLEQIKAEGYEKVIAIHISSGLSGTYNMINMVCKEFDGLEIEVIDSKVLSMGLGNLILYASNLIKAGENFQNIITKVKEKIKDIDTFFVVRSLKYLKEGGRIGKVSGMIGSLLNIKPIISIDDDGVYYTYKKTRGKKRSLNQIYEIAKEKIQEGLSKVDVIHGDYKEEAQELFDKLKKLENTKETFFGQLGPSMVVHAGPMLGVIITKIKDAEF